MSSQIDRLGLSVTRHGPIVVLKVTGDVDASNAHELRERIDSVIDDCPDCELVVDVTDMPFADSKAVSALIHASQRVPADRLPLVRPVLGVSRILQVAGLTDLFEIRSAWDDPTPPTP